MAISVVGVDLSKSVFQLSVADAKHHVIDRKRLSRAQFHRFLAQSFPARLVMEGCGTSNYWGRTAQLHGHEVKLLHAKHVKAYVRRTKTDAADADALVLADRDTSLYPIRIKSEELQSLQGLHRIRNQWKRARVARICEARAMLCEARGSRSTPTNVISRHGPNQFAHIGINSWSAAPVSARFPGPIQPKTFAMPTNQSVWLEDCQRLKARGP